MRVMRRFFLTLRRRRAQPAVTGGVPVGDGVGDDVSVMVLAARREGLSPAGSMGTMVSSHRKDVPFLMVNP